MRKSTKTTGQKRSETTAPKRTKTSEKKCFQNRKFPCIPPPSKKTCDHRLKRRILWAWGVFQQKEPQKMPGAHKIGAAIPAPELRKEKLRTLVSHCSAVGETISCDAPYSTIGFRGKIFLRYPLLLGLSLDCDRPLLRKEVGGVAVIVCDTTGNAVQQGYCYT